MTRFIHDQFAKDYLEELLTPYGTVQAPRRVAAEVREIDVWFSPSPQAPNPEPLGLLGRLAATPSIFEPFRNPANSQEIFDCLSKLLEVRREYYREAKRKNTEIEESGLPRLWILTPTESEATLSGFGAILNDRWLPGIYFMASYFRTAIVVIHQLPRTPETLWLRILGKGKVQELAIDEIEAMPADNQFRTNALTLLNRLKYDLQVTSNTESEDRELIMRLSPLFDQELERVRQEGQQQGLQQGLQQQRRVIENILRVRFGELDEQLTAIIEPLLALSPEEFAPLLLQLSNLSREELLARFGGQN